MIALQLRRVRQQNRRVEIEVTRRGIAFALRVPLSEMWPESALEVQ